MNFNIFGGFSEKNEYFGSMKKLWIFLALVITKLDFIWWSFLYILGFFLKINVQNGTIFGGLPKFQILFGGIPDIPDICLG